MNIEALEELTARPLIPTWLIALIFSVVVAVLVWLVYAYGQQQFERGHKLGESETMTKWQATDNQELITANAEIIRLQKQARDDEVEHQKRLAEKDNAYQEEKAREKVKTDAVERDLRNGNARLLVAANKAAASAAASEDSTSQTSPAQPGTGSGDAEARCELSPTVSAEIYSDYTRANEITKQLGLCQEIVAEDRRVCGTEAVAE